MMNEQDNIYVVLVKAHTFLGKFARTFSGYEYTHIAVCLDKPFRDFLSFSRRKHNNPFDCGFMRETLDCYAYGDHRDVKLKIFAVPVTPEEKQTIREEIARIEAEPAYAFNIYGMMTMGILHGLAIPLTHNCMSFTGAVLEQASSVQMTRDSYRYNIREFDELLTRHGYFYREGKVRKRVQFTPDYMDAVPLRTVLKDAWNLIRKLNARLVQRYHK